MALPITFAGQNFIQMSALDTQFAAVGALTAIPCAASGANVITLTPNANTPTIAAYANYQPFSFATANDNTSAVTAVVGGLAPLPVYKDTPAGAVALTGGEMQAGCLAVLTYDSALNSGSGGFHLQTGGAVLVGQTVTVAALILGTGTPLKRIISTLASLTFTNTAANTSQDQTVLLTGATLNDSVVLGAPAGIATGLGYMGFVAAAGTVTVRALNITAASLTPTGGTFRVTCVGFT